MRKPTKVSRDAATYDWFQHLPYDIKEESEQRLKHLCDDLATYLSGEKVIPFENSPLELLQNYVQQDYPISLELRITLAKLTYSLSFNKDLDYRIATECASLCSELISDHFLITHEDLTFDYKPCLNWTYTLFWNSVKRTPLPYPKSYITKLAVLATKSTRFFSSESTVEAFKLFLPLITSDSYGEFVVANTLANLLVTTRVPTAPDGLDLKAHNLQPFYWIPTMMTLWTLLARKYTNSPSFVKLFADLAENQFLYPENVKFNRTLVDKVYTAMILCLHVPLKSKLSKSSRMTIFDIQTITFAAKFIAWTIKEDDDIGVLENLEKLIFSLQNLFHPSNYGVWHILLLTFIINVADEFHRRINLYDDVSDELKSRFVNIIKPAVLLFCFNNKIPIKQFASAVTNLAYISPQDIIPNIIDKIFPTLAETSILQDIDISITVLNALVHPILEVYPEARVQLGELLFIAADHIDVNNPSKTNIVITFISNNFTNIKNDALIDVIESFVAKLLDRIFLYLENLPHPQADKPVHDCSKKFGDMISHIDNMFPGYVISHVKRFVLDHAIPNAMDAMESLVHNSAKSDILLDTFLKISLDTINEELDNGAATGISDQDNPFGYSKMSDSTLHWYQAVLAACMKCPGNNIIPYVDEIYKTLERCMLTKSGTASHLASSAYILFYLELTTINLYDNSITWYIPSIDSIRVAVDLSERMYELIVKNLEKCFPEPKETKKWLSVLEIWIESTFTILDPADCGPMRNKSLNVHYCKDPIIVSKLIRMREETMDVLYDYSLKLRGDKEDPQVLVVMLDCMGLLTTLSNVFNSNVARLTAVVNELRDTYQKPGTILKDTFFINAVINHIHLVRISFNFKQQIKVSKYDKLIASVGFWLSSPFSQVRGSANSNINLMTKCFGNALLEDLLNSYLTVIKSKGVGIKFIIGESTVEDPADSMEIEATNQNDPLDRIFGCLESLSTNKRLYEYITRNHKRTFDVVKILSELPYESKHKLSILWNVLFERLISNLNAHDFDRTIENEDLKLCIRENGWNSNKNEFKDMLVTMKIGIMPWTAEDYKVLLISLVNYMTPSISTNIVSTETPYKKLSASTLGYCLDIFAFTLCDNHGIPVEAMEFILIVVNSEIESIRNKAINIILRIFSIIRKRSKSGLQIDGYYSPNHVCVEIMNVNNEVIKDVTASFNQDHLPSVDEWETTRFYDFIGYDFVCWPSFIKVRKGYPENPETEYPYHDPESKDAIALLANKLTDSSFWTVFIKYRAQESSSRHNISAMDQSKTSEPFDRSIVNFFKYISLLIEDRYVETLLQQLDRLVSSDNRSEQKVIFEFTAGIIQGTKYWNGSKVHNFWGWYIPFLERLISFVKPDTVSYIGDTFLSACKLRDVRRMLPLIKLSFEKTLDPLAPEIFNDSKRMLLTRPFVAIYGLQKLPNIVNPFWNLMLKSLRHPYNKVRIKIASTASYILMSSIGFSCKNVSEVIAKTAKYGVNLFVGDGIGNPISTYGNNFDEKAGEFADSIIDLHNEQIVFSNRHHEDMMSIPSGSFTSHSMDMLGKSAEVAAHNPLITSSSQVSNNPNASYISGVQLTTERISKDQVTPASNGFIPVKIDEVGDNSLLINHNSLNLEGTSFKSGTSANSGNNIITPEDDFSKTLNNNGSTVRYWIHDCLTKNHTASSLPLFRYYIAHILHLQVYGDKELQTEAQDTAFYLADFLLPSEMLEGTLIDLLEIVKTGKCDQFRDSTFKSFGKLSLVKSESGTTIGSKVPVDVVNRWQVRLRLLSVIQIIYFNHLYIINENLSKTVMRSVADLLSDSRLEVQNRASETLSGLIRCSNEATVLVLRDRFINLLDKYKWTKKNPRSFKNMKNIIGEDKELEVKMQKKRHETIQKRHEAVLGLSALIRAFPYDVPKWMPNVLTKVAIDNMEDPNPIGSTVKQLFAEFKRTHQNTWEMDKQLFTEEELLTLTDLLVSPSYYA